MGTGKLFLGLIIGAAAGAVVSLLYAPDKGSETRRKLLDKGDDYAQNIKNRFNEFVNKVGKKNNGSEFTGENEFRQEPSASNPSF